MRQRNAKGKARMSLLGVETHASNGAGQSSSNSANPSTVALPAVGDVLMTASQTLKDFSADTNTIRSQVQQRQALLKQKMVVAKRRFELKLTDLKDQHANLTNMNDELRSSIRVVNETNAALVSDASDVQHSIRILQDTMSTLQERMQRAGGFLDDSLNVTDISNSTEYQVLLTTTPEPTLEHFLSKARSELGLNGTSSLTLKAPKSNIALLQTKGDALDASSVVEDELSTPKTAEKMTSLLMDTLDQLDKAEANAYRKLRDNYEQNKEKWDTRISMLLTEQEVLKKQYDFATQRKADLELAKQVVDGTRILLLRKLDDFATFLSHVDDAAKKTVMQAKR